MKGTKREKCRQLLVNMVKLMNVQLINNNGEVGGGGEYGLL